MPEGPINIKSALIQQFLIFSKTLFRAPSARDPWWNDHQQKCGGAYIKVKEPEGYGKKKGKKKDSEINKAKAGM